jgi:hypothetical protein
MPQHNSEEKLQNIDEDYKPQEHDLSPRPSEHRFRLKSRFNVTLVSCTVRKSPDEKRFGGFDQHHVSLMKKIDPCNG